MEGEDQGKWAERWTLTLHLGHASNVICEDFHESLRTQECQKMEKGSLWESLPVFPTVWSVVWLVDVS